MEIYDKLTQVQTAQVLSIPEGKVGLMSGCAEVSISVVNTETPSVATCAVAVDSSCIVVAVDISVVALLNSVLDVLDTGSVVFGVASSPIVILSVVVTVTFSGMVEATTVK